MSAPDPAQRPAGQTRPVWFLLHVPKCAGTTVEEHFRTHLGEGFLIAPRWESVARNFIGNRYPMLSADALAGVDVVSGHSLSAGLAARFPGRPVHQAVLLRDPLGYLLSFYNYRWTRHGEGTGPRPPGFPAWYAAQRRNPISRFLLNRYFGYAVPALYRLSSADRLAVLEECLTGFTFVGGYRRTDEMIAGVSRALGLPETVEPHNVTHTRKLRPEDLPDRLRQRIATDNAVDQALFDRWKDRGWEGSPQAPAPGLPGHDRLRYLIGDTTSVLRRKLGA